MQPSPILLYAAAGALFAGGTGGGWYLWQRAQQEAAKRLQHQDAVAAKHALRDEVDLSELRREAEEAGLDPDEVLDGYRRLRDSQISPQEVLEMVRRAAITD